MNARVKVEEVEKSEKKILNCRCFSCNSQEMVNYWYDGGCEISMALHVLSPRCEWRPAERSLAVGNKMENFDGENTDELLKIHQICQYFPCQFYSIR